MKPFLTAWAVLILCVSARAADCSLTLFATDSGWYTPANYHDPDNNNYLVGYHAAGATEFRDWFVFDIPPFVGPIQSMELRLFAFTVNSTNAETFELYHVATPVSTLVAGTGPTITRVFTDLGEGPLYGSRVVSVSEANNYITIPLNSNAVAEITAAGGQRFALGGKLTSISSTPTSDESLFSFSSGTAPNVQLIVNFAGAGVPLILQQPPPLVLLSGGSNTNIPVAACGPGTLRYQWFFNNSALTNQTNASLSLANVNAGRVGDYYLVVTNANGATTSSIARIYVDAAAPTFPPGAHPYRTFVIGDTADFYRFANGNPAPRLQWQFNGVNIPGATNDYLLIPNVQSYQAGVYTFVASNVFGVVSTNMFLTVEPLIVYIGDFGMESGNDYYQGGYVRSPVPVTYQWRFNGVNIAGANGSHLSFFNVSSNHAGVYDLIVANAYGVRTSDVARATVRSQAPSGLSVYLTSSALAGENIVAFGQVYGGAPIVLQWYHNAVPIDGGTNQQLLLRNVSDLQNGGYFFIASNAFGVSTSGLSTLTVNVQPPAITGFGVNGEAFVGDAVHLAPTVFGGPRPTLQWQFNGVDIPAATNTSLLLTNLSVAQSGVYSLMAANQFGTNEFFISVNAKPRRALDRWTWRNSYPQANDLKHIAFGNGRTVAGGEGGSIVTSTNGIDWAVVSLGQQYLISHLVFGNGVFVAIAEGTATVLFTSPDGIDWTARDLPFPCPRSLDFANGEFLMVGYRGGNPGAPALLARSANGAAWQVNPIIGPSLLPSGIRHGNGIYVAISSFDICTSRDTVHWTRHSVPGNFTRLTFANGLFIASSRFGQIWTSANGAHWSARNPSVAPSAGTTGDINGSAYGNGFYVAVGDDGIIVRSPDADVWGAVNSTTSQNLRDVIFDGTKFIACGNNGVLLTSSNSVTWTDRRIGKTKDLYGIIYTNDQFVAVGYEGTILTSPDGHTWTTRTSPNSRDLHAITHGGGQYVAVGRLGTVLTSPDAFNWTSRATPTTNYLQRAAWGNGRFVVTGEDATILSSTNGIEWQQHTASVPANTQMEGVAYGRGVFVIVGGYFSPNAHSIMLVSSNGITWSNVSYDLGVIARGVTFASNGFLTVGNDGAVILSSNGLAWSFPSSVPPYQNLRHIEAAAGRAVAVGNEGTIISYNLINWENHASIVAENLHDVAYGAGKFVAVGNSGAIVQSEDVLPVFSAPGISNGAMRFNLRGGMEPEYDVQSSEDFLSWSSEGTFTNDGSAMSFTIGTNGPLRFFRARAP